MNISKTLLSRAGVLAVVVLVVLFFIDNSDELRQLRLSFAPAAIVSLLIGVVMLLRGLAFHSLFLGLGDDRSLRTHSSLYGRALVLNQVLPTRVGSFMLAHNVKTGGNVSYPRALAIYSGSSLLSLILTVLLSCIGACWMLSNTSIADWVFVFTAGLLLVLAGAAVFLKRGGRATIWKDLAFFFHIPHGRKFVYFSLLELLVSAVALGITYRALSVQISFASSLFLLGIRNVSQLIAITPGALGISEVVFAYAGRLIELSAAHGVAVALILRCLFLGWAGIFWLAGDVKFASPR